MPDRELFEFDSFRLDPDEQLLLRQGEVVSLEPKVFETLVALVERGGRLVSKEELMKAVWPDSFVEESNLTRNISVLRKALQGEEGGAAYIETVAKRGYRFVGEVRALSGEPSGQTEVVLQSAKVSLIIEEEESDGETKGEGGTATQREGENTTEPEQGVAIEGKQPAFGIIKRQKLVAVLALPLLLATAAAAVYVTYSGGGGQAISSLAILPFVNVGEDPNTEYLADGITENLINNLSQVTSLKVMSRNSVLQYKGSETEAQEVGKQLGVRAVLIGRVVPQGDGFSINLELVDARDNRHLWGKQYNYKMADLPAMQTDISRDISATLRLRLSGEDQRQLTRRYTENAEAYELYLKGRYLMNALTNLGPKQALEYYKRATEIDPRFALAYAGMAEAYAETGNLGATYLLPPKEAYSQAKAAAVKAIGLDDTLAEAHASLARIAASYEWDWSGVEREYRRAIELNPNYVNARHWYSHYLITMGRFDESLAESRHALSLDPLDVGMTYHLGFHYYNARQYDQAEAQLQKALELDPNHSEVHSIMGLVYQQMGRFDDAIAKLQRNKDLGGTDHRGFLGHLYAISGRRDEALKLLAELQEESKHKSVSPYHMAMIYVGLGEKEQALVWLEKAYAERDSHVTHLKVAPEFDSLRPDSRFADLLRRIGFPP